MGGGCPCWAALPTGVDFTSVARTVGGGIANPGSLSALLPALVLLLIVATLAGGWWVFPRLQASMARSDCHASGHINCG